MSKKLFELMKGYRQFQEKYDTLMPQLAKGQTPQTLIVTCCDSRVDPAILLQCDPGDLFVIRNVANLIPPYENDGAHHGVSAALEFGICYLGIKDLIILGHSQCSGINAFVDKASLLQDDFISNWVSLIDIDKSIANVDDCAKASLQNSYKNAMTFPWIKERILHKQLTIHQWFFEIKEGLIYDCFGDHCKPLT